MGRISRSLLVSQNSTTHKIVRFYNEVWGFSLPLRLLAVLDCRCCGCFDLFNMLVFKFDISNLNLLLIMITHTVQT